METYFAPAERTGDDDLKREIAGISENPVVSTLLGAVSGLLAVLNEERQILTLNDTLLSLLGVDNAQEVLGLRPGEALQCAHAGEMPGGCGTSKFCSTCGAAIALVASLAKDGPVERICAMTVRRREGQADLYLRVRSSPVNFGGRRLLLLFLQDISLQQNRAVLERAYFHDLNNILSSLVASSELLTLVSDEQALRLARELRPVIMRLAGEVRMHQSLIGTEEDPYQRVLEEVPADQIWEELRRTFQNHPAAKGRRLDLPGEGGQIFKTDVTLLMGVLVNMVLNAFEASDPGETVRVRLDPAEGGVAFFVWNRRPIPEDVARRIFQRNFSTKADIGRGVGTYSMKLFGETFLGGKVDFTTSAEGTTFRIDLPAGSL